MKKNLLLLTGIVFLITILIAGGCGPKPAIDPPTVTIYLKAVKKDGEMHLKMYDSNNLKTKVIDTLETEVLSGSTVIWKRTWFNGIKNIEDISSTRSDGTIFKNGAKPITDTKRFMLEIPEDVSVGDEEEYDITFVSKRGNKEWTIDPYLRIRSD